MARRERTLTSSETIMGETYDKVRILRIDNYFDTKTMVVLWQCGYLDSGEWTSILHSSVKRYADADYDTLIAVGEGSAGQWEAIQDQIFDDIETDGDIGAGTEGDY